MNEPVREEYGTVPDRLKIQAQSAYKNVRLLNVFDFVEHTYFGSHGYRDCSYLIPHPREVFYETRRDSSYYVNIFANVINAMVNEVFTNEIARASSSVLFDEFIKNADGIGGSLQEIVEDAMYLARMSDVAFVVMDNYPKDAQPSTVEDAARKRVMPYIYLKRRQDIHKVDEDIAGRLIAIDFYDNRITIGGRRPVEVQTFRRWTPMTVEHYYEAAGKRIQLSMTNHNLGVLPVIPVTDFSRKKKISCIEYPSTYPLAFLCYALFNKESEIVSLEQYQCFSIFYVSGRITTEAIGHSNVIEVPLDAKFPPGYTSPNPAMMEGLVKNADRLKESIYVCARQKGVVALVEQSGIAKQWDFRGEESVLKRTALASYNLEMSVKKLFELFTKTSFEYTVQYPKQFSPSYQKDLILETLDIIKEQPPKPLEIELWKRLAQQVFPENQQLVLNMEEAYAVSEAGAGVNGEAENET